MKCSDVMKTDVECVTPGDTAQSAARKMRDENIGFLPVCDDDGRVLGTVTDRDLAIRLIAEAQAATAPVRDFMTKEVVSCKPDDDLSEAMRLMGSRHKSRILCLDDQGKLVGVISLSDIAEKEPEQEAGKTLREVAEREVRP